MSRQFPSALLRSLPAAGRQASRREVLAGLGAMALGVAGCSRTMDMPDLGVDPTTTGAIRPQISVVRAVTSPDLMYASFTDEGFQLPEVPFEKVNAKFRRQIVVDPTGEAPGTIVVNLQERFLYLVQPGGDAIRYGVGIGRDGFRWAGRANIQYGKKWPLWTPPAEMIARKPELEKWRNGEPALSAEEWTLNPFNGKRYGMLFSISDSLLRKQWIGKAKTEDGKGKADGKYGAVYEKRREHTAVTHPEWTPKHSQMDGLRIMMKEVIKDLWVEWNRHAADGRHTSRDPLGTDAPVQL